MCGNYAFYTFKLFTFFQAVEYRGKLAILFIKELYRTNPYSVAGFLLAKVLRFVGKGGQTLYCSYYHPRCFTNSSFVVKF